MELLQQILLEILKSQKVTVLCPDFDLSAAVDSICYRTLCEIRDVICDDTLCDPKCFLKIEKIICCFENIGSDGGNRHDFG